MPTRSACVRCQADKANHTRCTRMTCKYGFQCWQHSIKNLGLKVQKSTIPNAGQGLFTVKQFEGKKNIIEYKGEKLTNKQIDQRYPGDTVAPYAVRVNRKYHIDAIKSPTSSIARYANDARKNKTRRRNNAKLVTHKVGKGSTSARDKVFIKAKSETIPPNTEVLVNYRDEYWGGEKGKGKRSRKN